MSTTEPIRDKQKLQNFKNYFQNEKPNMRNYTMIIIGLNTALRISDILNLTYDEIFQNNKVQEHITIKERKTGKENRILLNHEVRLALTKYRQELIKTEMYQKGNPYLFPSPKKPDCALSRSQAYRIITDAADAVGIEGHKLLHLLLSYHFQILLPIKKIIDHSSPTVPISVSASAITSFSGTNSCFLSNSSCNCTTFRLNSS
ncbi:MAG: tyrosine-type recombinase/integrase [Lachnospiraceae bacterium]|nr:tyrosine-type recombinase/integrase [Lachnospiraceae bacterium]